MRYLREFASPQAVRACATLLRGTSPAIADAPVYASNSSKLNHFVTSVLRAIAEATNPKDPLADIAAEMARLAGESTPPPLPRPVATLEPLLWTIEML